MPESLTQAEPIALSQAVSPLVLAMDIGSTSSRAAVHDALARPVVGHQTEAKHRFHEASDGTSEIDADAMVAEISGLIGETVQGLPASSIAAVAMDTFASSLVCVDDHGGALTPCISYADARSAGHIAALAERLGSERVHQLTGVRLHTSYLPARLAWLRAERPEVWAATAKFASLGEYIFDHLAGVDACATATMAWAGMLDRHTGRLSAELLEATGVRAEQFGPLVDPDEPQSAIGELVDSRWPALAGAVWFPAIPDGYASNVAVSYTHLTLPTIA